jgi:hypothetical protein
MLRKNIATTLGEVCDRAGNGNLQRGNIGVTHTHKIVKILSHLENRYALMEQNGAIRKWI